ncbi:hypothetical protein H0H81_010778 [Sphagnurus paluster]|uniref:DUF4246 domain-containing protein n=1 Tax=Sphagnurus paluster TaxID=117069 RepID=A0A9P7G2F4_9AGAR|nr:hypothetical protein H0H81_010778 [Sphagnurus paluster]
MEQGVLDNQISAKWGTEAIAGDMQMSQKMIDWCLAELRYKAKIFSQTGAVSVYTGDVVKSDTVISPALQEALKNGVAALESVPEHCKDWHPGSDEKVLDLVHPSLFPLIYGRSRILPETRLGLEDCISLSGAGVIVPMPLHEEEVPGLRYWRRATISAPFSKNFQWLPCDVDISAGEGAARITSYINNLHPEHHSDLYGIIEKIIARTIPLWNMTLTPLKSADVKVWYQRIAYKFCDYDPDPESWPETEGPQKQEDEDEDAFLERRADWYEEQRNVVNIWKDYAETGIQVVIKLANIHLTPEKPEYEGGSWHVEGQLNEHICASAIYYYDSENITSSRLAFRQQSNTRPRVSYEQDHHDWLEAVFGCSQNEPGVQDVGTVDTREGRLLTWPNVLQHQVQPFALADRTRPGHRKILALFLVDPSIRVISTANIPCQQREWWSEAVRGGDSLLARLPKELQDLVFEQVEEFPIGLEEAKEVRARLMDERRVFVRLNNEAFHQYEFSLCEH